MRIAVFVLLCAANAYAQPVSYQTKLDVPLGQKPQIRITAAQPVSDIRIELARDDGKNIRLSQGALARNQAVTLSIGDGAAGTHSWKGTISAQATGEDQRWSDALQLTTSVRPPLHVGYDAEHLDLDNHELQLTMSRPAGHATITAIGEDGGELGKGTATFSSEKPSTWVKITWTQPANTRVLMLKLHAESSDGGATDVQLIPWSVAIDHEDVNFATDSAEIAATEDAKLAASVTKIEDIVKRSEKFVKMELYVAGHTDSVGPSVKNQKLSLARAQSIARYFRKQGITLPIAVAGFGESVLKVPTKDEVDEKANRRADYVIGPVGAPPPFKGPYLKAHASWSEIK